MDFFPASESIKANLYGAPKGDNEDLKARNDGQTRTLHDSKEAKHLDQETIERELRTVAEIAVLRRGANKSMHTIGHQPRPATRGA